MSLLKGIALLLVGSTCALQPGDGPQPPPEAPREAGQPVTRDSVRARLSKRLSEAERNAQSLRRAMARLEAGEDPESISREFDRNQRSSREPRDGGRSRENWSPQLPGKPELTEQEKRDLMQVLRESMPHVAARFDQLRQHDPQAAERLSARLLPRMREAFETRDSDPELFNLRMDELRSMGEVMAAAQELRTHSGSEAEKEPLRAALREALGRQFDARHASDLREITKLEERVADLQEEARRKLANRDAMIDAFSKKVEKDHDGPGRRREP